jgi:cytochrome c peroxidase
VKALALLLVLAACPKSEKKPIEPVKGSNAGSAARLLPNDAAVAIALPPAPPLPDVPFGLPPLPTGALDHQTPDQVALGALLFSDVRLSATGKIACATCHDPANRYAGVPPRARKINDTMPPQIENLAWNVASVTEKLPAHFTATMGRDLAAVELAPGYAPYVARVGADPVKGSLLAFVLTRYDGDSAWDHQERGNSEPGDLAAAGYKIFVGKGRCATCHTPPLYTDFREHDVDFETKSPTRSLRGCAERKSFFRSEESITLDQVLDWYTDDHPKSELHKLTLAPQERLALLTFLGALSGKAPPVRSPAPP